MARFVVLRSNVAGVHFGQLVNSKSEPGARVLKNARRAWSWQGALSCSELATKGPGKGSRICAQVSRVTITIAPGDEMIDATPEAVKAWQ